MIIAIHNNNKGFAPHWKQYCKNNNIPFKIVNCYSNNITEVLHDCNALMWHFHQNNPKDILFAKQLLFSLQQSGKKVFPDFNTAWHFDDKVGQKYLLESLNIPLVTTWVFYDKKEALEWAAETKYPVVFKLRGGAGSANVRLVKSEKEAEWLIKKGFGRGFTQYEPTSNLVERLRKYRSGKNELYNLIKGIFRIIYPPEYSIIKGRDRGYVYFQKYVPSNDHDIRVIVINNKAFAIKRMNRQKDFRASGSGFIKYEKENINEEIIKLSFDINAKIHSQSLALDYIIEDGKPQLLEISFGFSPEGYVKCPGYWDNKLNWHAGKFNPYGWIVENLLS